MNSFLYNEFIFSPRLRVWRHVIYWTFHICIWAAFWLVAGVPVSYARNLLNMAMWTPLFILFSYPLVYGAIPYLLLKRKVVQFFIATLAWGIVGLYLDEGYRSFVLIPLQEGMGLDKILPRGPIASCFLCMTTSAACPMIIRFFKLWTIEQKAWLQAQQEKIIAELQLLKSQVHPHFLFNTLNNIYSFSIQNSIKTAGLIKNLTVLLRYMLYDCQTEKVSLAKEIEIMKNYVDLERERYGSKIEIIWKVEGNFKGKTIAPLLMLPLLENSFKHGVSEQIGKSKLSVKIAMHDHILFCSIMNSKNEVVHYSEKGIGIANVKKRLEFIYPGNYNLNLQDQGNIFRVTLEVNLNGINSGQSLRNSFATNMVVKEKPLFVPA